jgi:CBS-domain-containing membrane protein
VCCEPHTALEEVRDVMAQRGIRHVPVIDRRRRLAGILATGDLLQQRIAESQSTIDTLCAYIHGPGVHVDG